MHLLMAACLFPLHHLAALALDGGAYTPFTASRDASLTYDETFAYAPPARRFMTTGRLTPESDNYELRDLHAAMPFASSVLLGALGRICGSLETGFIVADAIFPAALLFVFYLLAGPIVARPVTRMLIAWATLLIGFAPRSFLGLGLEGLAGSFEITRTPNPEVSVLFFLLAVIAVARAMQPEAGRGALLVATLASAINVYTYYFYTVGWAITLASFFLVLLVWKRWREAVRVAAIGAGSALLGIPFLIAVLKGRAEGGQAHLLAQFGDPSHQPNALPLVLALAGLGLILIRGQKLFSEPSTGLLCLAAIAGLLGMNVQILSGMSFQQYHFLYRLTEPVCLFLACCLIARLRPPAERTATVALAALLLFATGRQIVAATRFAPLQRSDTPEIQLLTWIRTNLPPQQVIGTSDPDLILLIPAITPDFTYIPSNMRTLTSPAEITVRQAELETFLNAPASAPPAHRLDYVIVPAAQPGRAVYSNRTWKLIPSGGLFRRP